MNHINKNLAFINTKWRYSLILILFLNFSRTTTEEVGKVFYNGYPHYVEARSPGVSIFFIIDNSCSMTRPEKDRPAHRFSVIRDMVDTIKNIMPKAQVGLAVFKQDLEFSIEDSPYFVIPPKCKRPYLKLLQLDKTYDNSQQGSDIIKNYLESEIDPITGIGLWKHKPSNPLPHLWPYKRTDPLPHLIDNTNITSGFDAAERAMKPSHNTNINIGFEAAKHAMKSSRWEKHNQFVIFISDGDATYPRDDTKNDFAKGIDVPTTFTIYFSRNLKIPQSIQVMTDNIAKNGYSVSNPLSKAWGYDNSFSRDQVIAESKARLSKFLMENIMATIFQKAVNIRRTISGSYKNSFIRIKGGMRFELPKASNLTLLNSQGRIIENLKANGNTFTVRKPAGIYFLKADSKIYRFVISE